MISHILVIGGSIIMNKENALLCDNCGGKLEVDSSKTTATCPFCGTCFSVSGLFSESDEVVIERIRRDVEIGRQSIESERLRQANNSSVRHELAERAESFKKSKLSKLSIIFAIISFLFCIFGFATKTPLMGIIAGIQSILYFITFFMGMQIIPEKRRNLHLLPFILALLLIIPFILSPAVCTPGRTSSKDETFTWDEIVLSEKIPALESEKGHIWSNTKSALRLNVYNIPIKQYYEFVESCKAMGYTIESAEEAEKYSAFDQSGYKLSLHYYSIKDGEVDIEIDAPEALSEFSFPDSELAKLIPIPKSNIGKIVTDSNTKLMINVGNTPTNDFNTYIDECIEKGFSLEQKRNEKSFSAKNADNYDLSVTYNGNGLITITVTTPKEDDVQSTSDSISTPSDPVPSQTDTSSVPNIDQTLIRTEIKEGLDSYEAFIDEYVSFMKKYSKSNNPATLIWDYSNYLQKLAEFQEKWDHIDTSDLNAAETAYYTKVMASVSKKLMEAVM